MNKDTIHMEEPNGTITFGEWFDWFFEKLGIDQDTAFDLDCGERTIKHYKKMLMDNLVLQRSAFSHLPGIAARSNRQEFIGFLGLTMSGFCKMGYLK